MRSNNIKMGLGQTIMMLSAITAIALIAATSIVPNLQKALLDSSNSPKHASEEYGNADEGRNMFPKIDWRHWQEMNEDIVGWMSVPGTSMDFPIVQADADAPAFYLDHDFQRRPNEEGCIFLDAECSPSGLLSRNSVIFGHHLKNQRGFSPFANYSDADFARINRTILLQTPLWQKELEVMFVEIVKGSSTTKVTSFENDRQFHLWLEERYDNSCVQLDNNFAQQTRDENEKSEKTRARKGKGSSLDTTPERIWTFCTCSYTKYADERTLVYATEVK